MPCICALEYLALHLANISNEKGTHCCQSSYNWDVFAVLEMWMFAIVRLENAKGEWKPCDFVSKILKCEANKGVDTPHYCFNHESTQHEQEGFSAPISLRK
jgi:hypothetical protein